MKYWAYVNNEILGPYEKEEIKALPAYSPSLLICPQTPVGEKTEDWREVSVCPEFAESAAAEAPIVSEQIPDQIEIGTLQIDHNFNMSNSGRLNSSRIGQLQPLENIGMPFNKGVEIPANKLARSGRVKSSDINWNLVAAEQELEKTAQQENNAVNNTAAAAPETSQPTQETTQSSDPFGDIYKDIANQNSNSAEQEQPKVEGLESLPSMADPAPAETPISLGGMTMQNTQEFSLGNDSFSENQNTETPSLGENLTVSNDALTQAAANFEPAQNDLSANVSQNNDKISGLERKIDTISRNTITREDFTMAVDPIKMKLDQFDDMFSSIRTSQNQQQSDVMSKLSHLEQALQSLASNINSYSSDGQPFMPQMSQRSSGGFDSVSLTPSYESGGAETASLVPADPAAAVKHDEKPKKHSKQEIKDVGKKASGNNIIVRFFKGLIKLIVFLVILTGLAYAAGAALKYFNKYNVSPIIIKGITKAMPDKNYKENDKDRYILPFLLENADWNEYYAAEKQNADSSSVQSEGNAQEPAVSNEERVINAVKSYQKTENGMTLEAKLAEKTGNSGASWEMMPNGENDYIINFLPEDQSMDRYSFGYNDTDGTVTGKDQPSQAIIDSLMPSEQTAEEKQPAAVPAQPAKKGSRGRRKAKAAPAEKPAEKTPAKAETPAQDGEFTVSLDDED